MLLSLRPEHAFINILHIWTLILAFPFVLNACNLLVGFVFSKKFTKVFKSIFNTHFRWDSRLTLVTVLLSAISCASPLTFFSRTVVLSILISRCSKTITLHSWTHLVTTILSIFNRDMLLFWKVLSWLKSSGLSSFVLSFFLFILIDNMICAQRSSTWWFFISKDSFKCFYRVYFLHDCVRVGCDVRTSNWFSCLMSVIVWTKQSSSRNSIGS